MPATKINKARKTAIKKSIRRKRPIHKRLLVHPISLFVLLCLGVLIAGTTYQVIADSYDVTASVPAHTLTEGAVITSPSNGYATATSTILVVGTCPDDSYVEISRNGAFSGSAWCDINNTFSIETGLSPGINILVAQDFNVTDDPGPATPAVNVIYSPGSNTPSVPAEPGTHILVPANAKIVSTSSEKTAPGQPLLLTSDFSFRTFTVGHAFNWTLDLGGGAPPYKVNIDWGDHSTSSIKFNSSIVFTISHIYKAPKYYPVKIRVTDKSGTVTVLQVAALIKQPNAVGFINSDKGSAPPSSELAQKGISLGAKAKQWLWLIWPSYVVLILMVGSFMLGEREEYIKVVKPKHHKRRRLA
jgi:hypothetical protein